MKEILTGEVTFLNRQDHWEIGVINSRNGWGWRLRPAEKESRPRRLTIMDMERGGGLKEA